MTTLDELTRAGGNKIASFFAACLAIGWLKSDLDWLEALWLKHHDKNGDAP